MHEFGMQDATASNRMKFASAYLPAIAQAGDGLSEILEKPPWDWNLKDVHKLRTTVERLCVGDTQREVIRLLSKRSKVSHSATANQSAA